MTDLLAGTAIADFALPEALAATRAAADAQEKMFECAICQNVFSDPTSLSCGHT